MTDAPLHNRFQHGYHRRTSGAVAQRLPLPIVEQCSRWMEAAIGALIEEAKAQEASTDSFAEAAVLLESVPLAADEFSVAKLHLRNAQLYYREEEFGAACFELRQLRSQIDAL